MPSIFPVVVGGVCRSTYPAGLLRGMRLGHAPTPWHELEQHRWLRPAHRTPAGPARTMVVARLLDPLPQTPGPDRMGPADWALRVASRASLRMLPPGAKLAALALRAHHSPGGVPASARAEADRISRACGTDLIGLTSLLDRLLTTRTLVAWSYHPATEELHWVVPPPHRTVTSLTASGG